MVLYFSYESCQLNDPQKDTVRNKFANTILFVGDYLGNMQRTWCCKDPEQPKLTYQVKSYCFFVKAWKIIMAVKNQ